MVRQENDKKNKKIAKSFISGGVAGVCGKTLIAPIQRVKYLFITSNRQFTYKEYIKDLVYIVKKNGISNLWRGNMMNVMRVFPHAAIDFSVFDFLRGKYYKNDGTKTSKILLFLCGAIAGISALTFTTPLQFLRVRMAMQRDNFTYNSNIHALKVIYTNERWIGFYKGYGASVAGIFIYHGTSFFVFTKLKEFTKKISPDSYSKWYVDFALGGLSAVGQLIAYPFDVLRKRMQGQLLLLAKKQIQKVQNYRELISKIIQKQGFLKGFYKGISLNMIKAPIGLATSWTVKNFLNRKLDKSYDL